jgi:hypothetical protein
MMTSVPYQLQSSRIGEERAERQVVDSKAGRTYADWSAEQQGRR